MRRIASDASGNIITARNTRRFHRDMKPMWTPSEEAIEQAQLT